MRRLGLIVVLAFGCTGQPAKPQPRPPETNLTAPETAAEVTDANAVASMVGQSATVFAETFPTFLASPIAEPYCEQETKVARWPTPPNNVWPPPSETPSIKSTTALKEGVMATGQSDAPDGWVRYVGEVDGALNMDLWMRSRVTSGATNAVGLRFRDDSVQLVEVVNDNTHELTPPQPVYRFDRLKRVELAVTTMGEHVFAQVYDGDKGIELLSLYAETHVRGPGTAVLEPKTNPGTNTVTFFGNRKLCSQGWQSPGDRQPVSRFFRANHAEVRRLSPDLRTRLTLRETSSDGVDAVWETDALTLEQIFCAGVDMWDLNPEPAWKYKDPDYTVYRTQPPVKDRVGFRTDLSYKNPRMVRELLQGWAAEFPEYTHLERIGTTHQGRPIWAMAIAKRVAKADPRPTILLNGAHHGDEPLSVDIVLDAIQYLLANRHAPDVDAWLSQMVIWTVPMVNPDGAEQFLERTMYGGRKNGRDLDSNGRLAKREGVDLNRNYPFRWASLPDESALTSPHGKWYRGPKEGSEPETIAMMALAERERFAASISYHTGTVCVLAPYTVEKTDNPEPNEAWAVARTLSQAMGKQIDGRGFKVRKNIYPVEGVDQDWLRFNHGTVALLIEAVGTSPDDYCERRDAMVPNRKAWQALLNRTMSGSVIIGSVKRANGDAVEAQVSIAGHALKNGEVWTSRPRDGLFVRYVEPGTYRVITTVNKQVHEETVSVGSSPVALDVVLP